jgi:hypothetical protein
VIDAHTCPAPQRDECELRYVMSLATKAERAEYLDRAERFDGRARTDALRRRVADAWHAAQGRHTPLPCRCEAARAAADVHHRVNEQVNTPGDGSFPAPTLAGPLRREGCVDSGAAVR